MVWPALIGIFTAVSGGSVLYNKAQKGELDDEVEKAKELAKNVVENPTQAFNQVKEVASDTGNWLHETATSIGEFWESPSDFVSKKAEKVIEESVAGLFGVKANAQSNSAGGGVQNTSSAGNNNNNDNDNDDWSFLEKAAVGGGGVATAYAGWKFLSKTFGSNKGEESSGIGFGGKLAIATAIVGTIAFVGPSKLLDMTKDGFNKVANMWSDETTAEPGVRLSSNFFDKKNKYASRELYMEALGLS